MALPGGDFAVDGFDALVARLNKEFSFLSAFDARRLARAYGTEAWSVLDRAKSVEDMGQHFSSGLRAQEVLWLMQNEFARTAEDVVWRLPPSLRGSKDDPEKRAAMEAIGESDRMTLLFRKAQ